MGCYRRAVDNVIIIGGFGIRAAARDHDINHAILMHYIKKMKNNPDSADINYGYGMNRHVFTDKQEQNDLNTGQKHTLPPPWESTGYVLETY